MSLGGESKIAVKAADWPENRLNDGEWHKLKLSYSERVSFIAVALIKNKFAYFSGFVSQLMIVMIIYH